MRKTRRPAVGELADDLLEERAARHGVEAERRIVQDEELGGVAERESEHDLALLALRELAERDRGRDVETAETLVHRAGIPAGIDPAAEIRERARRQRRRRVGLLRERRRCAPWRRGASSRSLRRRAAPGRRTASAVRAGSARARTCPPRCGREARRRRRAARPATRSRRRSLARSGPSDPRCESGLSRLGSFRPRGFDALRPRPRR